MTSRRACPEGHPLDPCWDLCPVCLQQEEADRVVGWLVFVSGPCHGQVLNLYAEENTIGSGAGCGIILPDARVSQRHCVIDGRGARLVLTDRGSASGTYVNHRRVVGSRVLVDHDRIRMGATVFTLREVGT